MYLRALAGYEKTWGPQHMSTLDTVNSLVVLYRNQGKKEEAEAMYQRSFNRSSSVTAPRGARDLAYIGKVINSDTPVEHDQPTDVIQSSSEAKYGEVLEQSPENYTEIDHRREHYVGVALVLGRKPSLQAHFRWVS